MPSLQNPKIADYGFLIGSDGAIAPFISGYAKLFVSLRVERSETKQSPVGCGSSQYFGIAESFSYRRR